MQVITESAEHHFLTTLEKLKQSKDKWMIVDCPLSKKYTHDDFVDDIESIPLTLQAARIKSEELVDDLLGKAKAVADGYIYLFKNCDVLMLANVSDPFNMAKIASIHKELSATLKERCSDAGLIPQEMYKFQKLADKKLLKARCFEAYEAMTDEHKVESIPLRRERKERASVLLVEDDRFTAAHASSILDGDYDVIISRSAEDAIIDYINHAPDIVYMDIHLPGLSGLEALKAIKNIDKTAYVVVVSVDASTSSLITAKKNGVQNFIKKPFSKNRLKNVTIKSPFVNERMLRMRVDKADEVRI